MLLVFLSHGWGGHVSDKEITLKSRFLDYLQHGECILVDCGFTTAEELAPCGATLKKLNDVMIIIAGLVNLNIVAVSK